VFQELNILIFMDEMKAHTSAVLIGAKLNSASARACMQLLRTQSKAGPLARTAAIRCGLLPA